MKEPLDDFLEQIKRTLLSHEETYDEGAWERFAEKNLPLKGSSKPVIPIWKWAAAAAAILTGALLLTQFFNTPEHTKKDFGSTLPVAKNNDTKNLPVADSNASMNNNIQHQTSIPEKSTIRNYNQPYYSIVQPSEQEIKEINAIEKDVKAASNAIVQHVEAEKQQQNEQPAKKPFWQSQIVENNVAASNTAPQDNAIATTGKQEPVKSSMTDKISKWSSSLYLSPNYGTDNINMGYGYALSYAVNDKIRISSGIAYAKVSTSKNYSQPASSGSFATDNSNGIATAGTAKRAALTNYSSAPYLQSVESWISGVDVPVELSYTINKKLYAAGGVSGLFVLNGQDKRTYIDNMNSRATVISSQGQIKEDKNVSMSDEIPLAAQEPTSFLGFYNASIGFKQKISNKNAVSIEPFVKIPMKPISDQKLNYRGVGVRLKFDF
ncbi:MAG: hypothetical protein ACK5NK_11265 [Niabella sp.]